MSKGSTYRFGPDDIRRYLQGQMNSADMHALEKAALDDPFLWEAIEGYRGSGTDISADLAALKDTLKKRKHTLSAMAGQPLTAEGRKQGWLPIAAAAALFGVMLVSSYLLQPVEQVVIAKAETTAAPITEPDRIADTAVNAPLPEATPKNEGTVKAKKADAPPPTRSAPTVKVTDEQPAVAAAAKPAADEVPAAPAEEKARAMKTMTAPRAAPATAVAPSAEPFPGWKAYQDYIRSGIRKEADTTLRGRITVSFLIDAAGTPVDLKLEKGFHPGYDQQVIDLIRKGPKWKPSSHAPQARTSYTISL